VLTGGHEAALTPEMRELILETNDDYAARTMRVLGFAYGKPNGPAPLAESDLVFVGLQAMIDPPRPEVVDSIAKTRSAGIRVIMITGDYQATAKSIGKEIGIIGKVCTGEQLEQMDDRALLEALRDDTNIFARVVPEHKQRIVRILQQMGHTVAMTGDGVNDAPALIKADIGVAVGSGTEVAKEAADFVLLDDSFTHIVNAIEEGRGIYDNIQKSIMLLLSGNLGEVLIIFIAIILGMNLPLTAILLLWINMITDGAPALAYSVDPYGTNIMQRRPKPRDENILPGPKLALIAVLGSIGTILALSLFSLTGGNSPEPAELMRAQTMVFNFIVIYELILVFVIRSSYQVPIFSNQWIWWSVSLSLALQGALMYTPLHTIFKITPLNFKDLGILGASGVLFLLAAFFYQYLMRSKRKTAAQ
jgi:Ca2+-transporting ATPase